MSYNGNNINKITTEDGKQNYFRGDQEMSEIEIIFLFVIISHVSTGDPEREDSMEERVMTRGDNT